MGEILELRRELSLARINELRKRLAGAEKQIAGKACVYMTGSFGRMEASQYSDLDLFIAGKTSEGGSERLLRVLDEILLKAELIQAIRDLKIPDFSGDGEYLRHYSITELKGTLGKPEDDATNTFTARLLLLLESQPLLGTKVYWEIVGDVVAAYWKDFADHKEDFEPAFLANDILRLWRTFCVNYEARTSTDPPAKKAKRKLKNYKLKHSRLLTCYSALLYLLWVHSAKKTVSPNDVIEMIGLSPTQRLERLAAATHLSKIDDLVRLYEDFLRGTDASEEELVKRFLEPDSSRAYFAKANHLGETVFNIFQEIDQGSRFHRLLVV